MEITPKDEEEKVRETLLEFQNKQFRELPFPVKLKKVQIEFTDEVQNLDLTQKEFLEFFGRRTRKKP